MSINAQYSVFNSALYESLVLAILLYCAETWPQKQTGSVLKVCIITLSVEYWTYDGKTK